MENFHRTKAFVILLTLLIILAGVPTILVSMGQGDAVKSVAMSVLTPIQGAFWKVGQSFGGFARYFTEFDRLEAENKMLSERLAELSEKISDAELLKKENEWMRSYLGIKRIHTDFEFCDADIIGREAGSYFSSFTLNRGSGAGIEVNMPVVTSDGIVGRVTEVGLTYCRVSAIINYDSGIGAYVERSGALGIVSGDFKLKDDGLCVLEYLSFDADIEVGDRIISSGLGSVYPRGLVIGEVTKVTGDAYSHAKTAVIKPAAAPTEITRVMIITDYTVYTEE